MRGRAMVVGGVLAALVGSGLTPLATPAAAQEATPPPPPAPATSSGVTTVTGDGSSVVPVTPTRLLDTRGGAVAGAGQEMAVLVSGRGGVPTLGVSAAVLSVMVTGTSAAGHVTAWPTGDTKPVASSLNYAPKQTAARTVVVKVGKDGKISVAAHTAAHLVVDVQAWVPEASGITPVVPARILDRRPGSTTVDGRYAGGGRTMAKGTIDLPVAGRGGVPADASSALLNITITGATAPGHITAFPTGARRPEASNLNYVVGRTTPNLVLARIGAGGRVSLYVHAPTAVIVDVVGWVRGGGEVSPLVPARLADGRTTGATRPGTPMVVQVGGRGGVPSSGVRTVALNVTAIRSGVPGGVTAYGNGTTRPSTTQLAYMGGETVAGLVLVPVGADGKVALAVSAPVYLLVDVLGWTADGTSTSTLSVPDQSVFLGAGDLVGDVQAVPPDRSAITLRPSADPVAVGQHVALGPTPQRPEGLLGRVVSVAAASNGTAVVLEAARLDEVIPKGEVTYKGRVQAPPGLRAAYRAALLSGIRDSCKGVGTLAVDFNIDVALQGDFHYAWGGDGGLQLRAVVRPTISTTMGLSGSIGGQCEVTLPKAWWPIPTAPVALMAEVEPKLTINVVAKGLEYQETVTWSGAIGVERLAGGDWNWIAEGSSSASEKGGWDFQGFGGGAVTVSPVVAVSLGVWGRVKLEVTGGPELSVAVTRTNADWMCSISIARRIAGALVVDLVLYEQRVELGLSVSGSVPLGDVGCGTEPPANVATVQLDRGLVGIGYYNRLAAEGGIEPLTWSASNLPAGLRIEGAAITGTPTAAASQPVTLTVKDAAGRSTSKTLTLAVTGSTPEQQSLLGKIARWSDGTAFYVDKRGGKHHIPNGGVYECLVAQGKAVVATSAGVTDPLPKYEDAACVQARPGDIVSIGGAAHLVESDFGLRHVLDGISYECLTANGHKAYGQVPRYWQLDQRVATPYTWHCWNRDTAKGKVVRFSNGEAHYVDLRGGRHWVPNGGTYDCIKAQRGDYGHVVPASRLTELTAYENAVCVKANVGQIVKFGTASYLIGDGYTARHITDGISYMCLTSNGHTVYGGVPRYWLLDLPQGAAYTWHCWNKEAAKGKVVRFSDGSSWYVDLRGGRHHVPDGGTYECIKAQRGDYGSVVPADRLVEMTRYEDAQCVRAGIGNIVKQGTASYLVAANWTRRHITDGISHDCLTANGHGVYGAEVPRYWLLDLGAAADYTWHCWNRDAAKGKVVRAGDGSSWYVDLRGGRHWIPDGGTYECIKGQRGDYGHKVPRYSINELPQYENAVCMRPPAGSIVRHPDGDAWLFTGSSVRHIVNGATYNCYRARGRQIHAAPRYWLLDAGRGADVNTGEACNIILTHSGGGDSHWITPEGTRRWIPSTTVYHCIANRGVPRFWTGDRGLIDTGWRQVAHATC